jgi:hypothetical protein
MVRVRRLLAALHAALSALPRRRTDRASDHPCEPPPPAACKIELDLRDLADETLTDVAMQLVVGAAHASDPEAARLLHGLGRQVHEHAVSRAERRVVRFAEYLLQVRVWRAPE